MRLLMVCTSKMEFHRHSSLPSISPFPSFHPPLPYLLFSFYYSSSSTCSTSPTQTKLPKERPASCERLDRTYGGCSFRNNCPSGCGVVLCCVVCVNSENSELSKANVPSVPREHNKADKAVLPGNAHLVASFSIIC